MMFLFRRKKQPLDRKAFVRYKMLLAIYTAFWLALCYLLFYECSFPFLVSLFLAVVMMALAPALADLFQSRKAFESDEEEMSRFFPEDTKDNDC